MTPEQIAELERLLAAATPGPWQARFLHRVFRSARMHADEDHLYFHEPESQDWADCEAMAALRNAAPALIAAAERAEARNAAMTCARLREIADYLAREGYADHAAELLQHLRTGCIAELEARDKAEAETQLDHERLLEHARNVRGRRDVHSVYEVLDWQAYRIAELEALVEEWDCRARAAMNKRRE